MTQVHKYKRFAYRPIEQRTRNVYIHNYSNLNFVILGYFDCYSYLLENN